MKNDTSEMTFDEYSLKEKHAGSKPVSPLAAEFQEPLDSGNHLDSRQSGAPVSERSDDSSLFLSCSDPVQIERSESNERELINNERIEKQRMKTLFSDQQIMYEQLVSDLCIRVDESRIANELLASKLVEQTKTSYQFERLYESTKEEMEQVKVMAANTAHDLKSPLQTLVLGIESIRSIDPNGEVYQETINCLESACAFMSSAINRTIEYSRINCGVDIFISNTSFDLYESLKNPVRWMTTTLPLHGKLALILDPIPIEMNTILSDKHYLEENLLCLLSNAIKYSTHGIIRVNVSTTENNKNVRVTVTDNGIGISDESKIKLFKKFSSVQNMATGSTGLGLYSLLKRSEAIRGSCGMDNRQDGEQGSIFWFEFPYIKSVNIISEKTTLKHTIDNLKNSVKKLNILIVDDSSTVVKILTKKLEFQGHKVISCCNGADGVEKMVELVGQLDLVFMDVQMPIMDGIEATRRYREIESSQDDDKHLKIICSSANSGVATDALAIAAGVDGFLPKPFSLDDLLAAIAEVEISPP
eukprot:CAMPEP_0119034860 /NCGR_PEP_ID=MMETSP1177-20130426/1875_1 /TAXON_ID=2985 /ORGANISM="Ochromonas sp, Strain CCMP1899" /LENGTH=529 /DNA_ID=CAMNT_0006992639 /DNA_START=405 /DNA_END=1994 /DNA_ORIENTATION=+